MVPRVTERSAAHNNNTLLLCSCCSVPLFIWHCMGGFPMWGVVLWGEDEELEMVGVVVEEEGVRVRLYSPAHSRPVVYERISPENSSCSALWQDPPDCSPHKEPQLPEHYWFKERAREQTAWAPCPPPTPFDIHRLALSFLSPSLWCPNCTQKLCIPHINPRMGAVCGGTAVCKPHCKWVFSFSLPPSLLYH